MRKIQTLSLAKAGSVVVCLALLSGIFSFPPQALTQSKSKRLFIQATAQGTSTQLGRTVSVNIIINEYSTPEDQKALIEAFEQNGSQGLYNAVDKMKAKGRMSITGTLGYDVNYIREFPMPDGSRKIRMVTDRPILFGEAWGSTRSKDYNISAAEIILSKDKSKSTGTLLPACELKLNKDHGLEIENYQFPWKLVNIQLR
jgi:hypothetical protein